MCSSIESHWLISQRSESVMELLMPSGFDWLFQRVSVVLPVTSVRSAMKNIVFKEAFFCREESHC